MANEDDYNDYEDEIDSPTKKDRKRRDDDLDDEDDELDFNPNDKFVGMGMNVDEKKKRQDLSQRIDFFLRVLALLCETYYEHTRQLVEQENILAIVAPIMIDSEEYERDKFFRKRLLRGASILFASITASKNDDCNKGSKGNPVL